MKGVWVVRDCLQNRLKILLVRRFVVDSDCSGDSDCLKWVFDPRATRIARNGFLQFLTFKVQYCNPSRSDCRPPKRELLLSFLVVGKFSTRIARIAKLTWKSIIAKIGFRKSIFAIRAIPATRAIRVDHEFPRITKYSWGMVIGVGRRMGHHCALIDLARLSWRQRSQRRRWSKPKRRPHCKRQRQRMTQNARIDAELQVLGGPVRANRFADLRESPDSRESFHPKHQNPLFWDLSLFFEI